MAKAHLHLTIDEDVKRGMQRVCVNLSYITEQLFIEYLTWSQIYDKKEVNKDIAKRVIDAT